jgi:hypothetical protein
VFSFLKNIFSKKKEEPLKYYIVRCTPNHIPNEDNYSVDERGQELQGLNQVEYNDRGGDYLYTRVKAFNEREAREIAFWIFHAFRRTPEYLELQNKLIQESIERQTVEYPPSGDIRPYDYEITAVPNPHLQSHIGTVSSLTGDTIHINRGDYHLLSQTQGSPGDLLIVENGPNPGIYILYEGSWQRVGNPQQSVTVANQPFLSVNHIEFTLGVVPATEEEKKTEEIHGRQIIIYKG